MCYILVMLRRNAMYFKSKNFFLIQPDTRDLNLRSAGETLVHFVVAFSRILGIDIYHKITI